MSPQPPTLTLDIVHTLSLSGTIDVSSFHLYGIFLQEYQGPNANGWQLSDETCVKGIRIKLCSDLALYPRPKPGDVVRIHRASWDKITRFPVALSARNVIVWPAFAFDPTPLTIAKNPTITDEDIQRRRCLESYYCSSFDKIINIKPIPASPALGFYRVAGRVLSSDTDSYGNCLLMVEDETGKILVRVFEKQLTHEIRDHFEVAVRLELGDFVAITNAKLDNKGDRLNLSANAGYGRSIRQIEKDSILGVQINGSLGPMKLPSQEPIALSSQSSSQPVVISASAPPILRRSPRLNKQAQLQLERSTSGEASFIDPAEASRLEEPSSRQENREAPVEDQFPQYTTIADISKTTVGTYNFYNIAGQVRGQPNETRQYNNWVFQLYDGSKIDFVTYFTEEVKEPVADCATIMVYSQQKPGDTDQHIEVVKQLNEGDLVLIKNIKASWRYGQLRLEMSANLAHGKSINLIDKDSSFGIKLLEIVTNPFVDELVDDQLYSTPPDAEHDSDF